MLCNSYKLPCKLLHCNLCSEVPWTTGHVTDIRQTPQAGTTAQVSVVVYEMYCVSSGVNQIKDYCILGKIGCSNLIIVKFVTGWVKTRLVCKLHFTTHLLYRGKNQLCSNFSHIWWVYFWSYSNRQQVQKNNRFVQRLYVCGESIYRCSHKLWV